jgi:hypothetical protein
MVSLSCCVPDGIKLNSVNGGSYTIEICGNNCRTKLLLSHLLTEELCHSAVDVCVGPSCLLLVSSVFTIPSVSWDSPSTMLWATVVPGLAQCCSGIRSQHK